MFINDAFHGYAHNFHRLNFRFTISSISGNLSLLELLALTLGAGRVSMRSDGTRCDFYCNSLTDLPTIFEHFDSYPFLSYNDERLSIVESAFLDYDATG